MDLPTLVLVSLSIVLIYTIMLTSNYSTARKSSKLPPGPSRLPIIGNLLNLGSKPHQSLARLSKKYGPVISLKLGSITTIVVSSPETAKIVLQKHDLLLSSRRIPAASHSLKHHEFSMVWLPVGDQWRKLRKICREQMFSVGRLEASQGVRREKLQKLYKYVRECSEAGRAVDIGEAAFTTSLNLLSGTLLSVELAQFNTESSHEMKDLVWDLMRSVGTPNLADYFPILKPFDPQGILKQTDSHVEKMFAIFDGLIDEKMKSNTKKNDLVEALLDMDGAELTRNDINHLLLDLFVAGTDTTTVTVEWAMTELLRNPDKMTKVRDEIKKVIQEKGQEVEESDIPSLPYLQAVVKETFRLHPAGPLLVPHKAESQVDINCYIVPKDAQILVNFWAISRDPTIWSNPDSFEPERFMAGDHSSMDYRGKDFELIPFGAGRRMCPGLPLAYKMVHLMLAALAGNFGWKLEGDMKPQDLDMGEKFGLTLQKAIPLKAIPTLN